MIVSPPIKLKLTFAVILLMLFIGFTYFWIGFHNVDLCQNLEALSLHHNFHVSEVSLSGDPMTLTECYLAGLRSLIIGFFLTFASSLLLGFELAVLTSSHEKLIQEKS